MLFVVALAITGCGSSYTDLEGYIKENPSARQSIDQTAEALSDDTMTTRIGFEKNTVVITETLGTAYSDNIVAKMKKSKDIVPSESFDEAISQLEEASGIEGVTVKLVLNNGNGEKILESEYK